VISASYSSGPDSSGYETWTFSGTATGATQFYISYTVSGTTYYDPGNSVNYTIGASSTTSATSTTTTGTVSSTVSSTATSTSTSTSTSKTTTSTTTAAATTATGTGVSASSLPPILPTSYPSEDPATPLSGCNNWNGLDSCTTSGVYEFTPSAENRRWQTPPEGDPAYFDTFQDYSDLIGYADIQYSASRTTAVVTVNAASKTDETLTYNFGGTTQSSNTFKVDSSFSGTLAITVTSASGKTLVLEPLNFIWQNVALSAAQSTFNSGQKGAIVELFGWPYNDVAKECSFLGAAGRSLREARLKLMTDNADRLHGCEGLAADGACVGLELVRDGQHVPPLVFCISARELQACQPSRDS
jgi:alpha-amylase